MCRLHVSRSKTSREGHNVSINALEDFGRYVRFLYVADASLPPFVWQVLSAVFFLSLFFITRCSTKTEFSHGLSTVTFSEY